MVGLITFAIIAFLNAVTVEFNIGKFGARLFAAIAFGILAAYSAREADKNGGLESKNRQIELELASIDMYLSKLPEENQIEIKIDLARKWFGNISAMEKDKKDNLNAISTDLLKMVLDNLTKLK